MRRFFAIELHVVHQVLDQMLLNLDVIFRKFQQKRLTRDLSFPLFITFQKANLQLLQRPQLQIWCLSEIRLNPLLVL